MQTQSEKTYAATWRRGSFGAGLSATWLLFSLTEWLISRSWRPNKAESARMHGTTGDGKCWPAWERCRAFSLWIQAERQSRDAMIERAVERKLCYEVLQSEIKIQKVLVEHSCWNESPLRVWIREHEYPVICHTNFPKENHLQHAWTLPYPPMLATGFLI